MGLGHLAQDPRYRTFADRLANRDELIPQLKRVFLTRTNDEWIGTLRGHVPCAPVYTVSEALAAEQVLAREMVISYEHPRFGTLRQVGCPIKIDDVRPRYGPASRLGADTGPLLNELLGMGEEEIAGLRARGVV
jgi:crotonobetainyl-CoA:carnitine CoA-transferase CaiB-like acyl-CoA transferase